MGKLWLWDESPGIGPPPRAIGLGRYLVCIMRALGRGRFAGSVSGISSHWQPVGETSCGQANWLG